MSRTNYAVRLQDIVDVQRFNSVIMSGINQKRGPTKQKGGKEFSNSIFRPDADNYNWEISHGDGGLLIFYDHKTKEHHTAKDVAKELGIDWRDFRIDIDDEGKKHQPTKVEYTNLKDYAERHGVTLEWMKQQGFTEVDSFLHRTKDKEYTNHSRAMQFYVRDSRGTPQPRWRIFSPGNGPRWLQNHDFKPGWYGLDRAVYLAKSTNKPLVLVNGELTAQIAQWYGIPACVVGGGGEKPIPSTPHNDLLKELENKWSGDIWICLDCDYAGEEAAQKIYLQLQNNRRGIVDLKLQAGADLADWLNMYSGENKDEANRKITADRFWKLKVQMYRASPNEIKQYSVEELAKAVIELQGAIREKEAAINGEDNPTLTPLIEKVELLVQRAKGFELGSRVELATDTIDRAAQYLDDIFNSKDGRNPHAVYTEIPEIDYFGATNKGEVSVLSAISGSGKSFCASTIALNVLQTGKRVLILPTETSPHMFMYRLVSAITFIPVKRILRNELTAEERQRVIEQISYLKASIGRTLGFFAGSHPTPLEFKSGIQTAIELFEESSSGMLPDLLIIDSMSNIAPENDMSVATALVQEVKNAAEKYKFAVWMTQQADVKKITARKPGEHFIRASDVSGTQHVNRIAESHIAIYNPHYWIRANSEFPESDWNKDYAFNEFCVHSVKSRFDESHTMNKIVIHKWSRVLSPNDPIIHENIDF